MKPICLSLACMGIALLLTSCQKSRLKNHIVGSWNVHHREILINDTVTAVEPPMQNETYTFNSDHSGAGYYIIDSIYVHPIDITWSNTAHTVWLNTTETRDGGSTYHYSYGYTVHSDQPNRQEWDITLQAPQANKKKIIRRMVLVR